MGRDWRTVARPFRATLGIVCRRIPSTRQLEWEDPYLNGCSIKRYYKVRARKAGMLRVSFFRVVANRPRPAGCIPAAVPSICTIVPSRHKVAGTAASIIVNHPARQGPARHSFRSRSLSLRRTKTDYGSSIGCGKVTPAASRLLHPPPFKCSITFSAAFE